MSWRPAWVITVSSRTALDSEQDFIYFLSYLQSPSPVRKERGKNISFLEEKDPLNFWMSQETNKSTAQTDCLALKPLYQLVQATPSSRALSGPAKTQPAPGLSDRARWPEAPCGKAISHLAVNREALYIPPFPPSRPDTQALQPILAEAPGQCTVAGHGRKRYRDQDGAIVGTVTSGGQG